MTKKNLFLVLAVVALAAVYVIYFTDWFKPKTVQIFHTSRDLRPRLQKAGATPTLIFGFTSQLKLTEIKVVPLAEFQTNQQVLPLWHLTSDSNSVPVKTFFYGQMIRGMKPAIKGTHPASLESNTTYRLFVVAGKVKGEHDFEMGHK